MNSEQWIVTSKTSVQQFKWYGVNVRHDETSSLIIYHVSSYLVQLWNLYISLVPSIVPITYHYLLFKIHTKSNGTNDFVCDWHTVKSCTLKPLVEITIIVHSNITYHFITICYLYNSYYDNQYQYIHTWQRAISCMVYWVLQYVLYFYLLHDRFIL